MDEVRSEKCEGRSENGLKRLLRNEDGFRFFEQKDAKNTKDEKWIKFSRPLRSRRRGAEGTKIPDDLEALSPRLCGGACLVHPPELYAKEGHSTLRDGGREYESHPVNPVKRKHPHRHSP
jgi:hypothetical protein